LLSIPEVAAFVCSESCDIFDATRDGVSVGGILYVVLVRQAVRVHEPEALRGNQTGLHDCLGEVVAGLEVSEEFLAV